MPDLVVHEEEVYEDEDDENDEANWRNDYPDEESDTDEDREERYGGEFVLSSSDKHYSLILIEPNPFNERPFLCSWCWSCTMTCQAKRDVFSADYWEEEHSYSRGSWQHYQRELLRELSCRDDEDEGGCLYDSDWSAPCLLLELANSFINTT